MNARFGAKSPPNLIPANITTYMYTVFETYSCASVFDKGRRTWWATLTKQ